MAQCPRPAPSRVCLKRASDDALEATSWDDVMHDPTIEEIERWLRECARASERKDAGGGAADSTDAAQDQDRPFWPYLESDDFWRE